jgi:hypothetical protein
MLRCVEKRGGACNPFCIDWFGMVMVSRVCISNTYHTTKVTVVRNTIEKVTKAAAHSATKYQIPNVKKSRSPANEYYF